MANSLTDNQVFGDSDYYSGNLDNIERILTMIDIGTGRLSSLTPEQLRIYRKEADRVIDSRLSPFYAVPLVKEYATGLYPEPVPFIAARIVAADVIHNEFTEIDAASSEAATTMKNNALLELDRLADGILRATQLLPGQRRKSGVHFACPGITPRPEPPKPLSR